MSRIWPWRNPAARDWTVALALLALGLADIAMHPHSKQFPDPLWANYAFLLAGAAAGTAQEGAGPGGRARRRGVRRLVDHDVPAEPAEQLRGVPRDARGLLH